MERAIGGKRAHLCIYPGSGWFRVFGKGLGWTDTRRHGLRFSVRNGLVKSVKLGPWVIEWLA